LPDVVSTVNGRSYIELEMMLEQLNECDVYRCSRETSTMLDGTETRDGGRQSNFFVESGNTGSGIFHTDERQHCIARRCRGKERKSSENAAFCG
jgi:hypothetical protein